MAKEKCENCGGTGRTDPMLIGCERVECPECRGVGFVDREADYWSARASIKDAVVKFPDASPFVRGYPIIVKGETRQFIERMRQYLMVMELNADAVEK